MIGDPLILGSGGPQIYVFKGHSRIKKWWQLSSVSANRSQQNKNLQNKN